MPTPRDRRARLAIFAVFFVQGLTFATLLTQVAALQKKHGLSDGELSVLLLVVPVIAGAGSVLAGEVARRRGSRLVLRVAQPLAGAAVVLAGLAASVPQLVAANVLFGLCLGAVDAGMNMQAVAVERRYGRPVLTGFHALWSAAAVLGAAWASAAGGLGLGLAATFAVAMAAGVAVAVAAGPTLCAPEEEHVAAARNHVTPENQSGTLPVDGTTDPASGREGARFPWRPILPLCLAMAFLYVGDASISNFGSVYMDKIMHAGAAVIPLALGAYQATTFVVRAGGDLAVRRYGAAAIVRIGGALAALGFAGIVAAPSEPLAIISFGVAGVGLSVVAPQSFSAAGRLDPAGTGVAIARVNMFNYVGFIVGAALVGGIADAANYQIAFAAPLVLAAAIIALAPGFQAAPSLRRPRPAEA
ncbi:MFS transporter [Sphaerisporangium krabiense]|uniref:MFS family permease n=1 Tax=Sphaerisporangium krabiense TaxID=763782 RepID=A0A7W8Z529_9ACTN|nr:MFS transporter [Sphaerisporangium krabiense]MBB5627390.1 MFS family permease [Sphaerisporangium krabiense]GII64474.1 MFS transporter [Sphaerisporangium krabiense]